MQVSQRSGTVIYDNG